MQVLAADGTDCTPKGNFKRAVLGLLATSPRASISRERLKTLLWPDKSATRASASLRNILSVLRTELEPLGGTVLLSDDHSVGLDLARLWVDIHQWREARPPGGFAPGEFLEGLDLGPRAGEALEDWLRCERQRWSDLFDLPGPDERDPPVLRRRGPDDDLQGLSARLGEILRDTMPGAGSDAGNGDRPCIALVLDQPGAVQGLDRLLDRLAVSVSDVTGADLVDRRPNRAARPGAVPVALLRLAGRDEGHGNLHLRMTLEDAETGQRLCGHSAEVHLAPGRPDGGADGLQIDSFIAHCSDLAALAVDRLPRGLASSRATAFEAMRQMFRLEPGALDEAERMVHAGQMAGGGADFDSLAAYLETVRLGENPVDGEPDDGQIQAALRACSGVESGPAGGMSVTLAGYALDFLAADTERAAALMQRAAVASPDLALAWDHLGMLHFRRRAYDEALACARRAVLLGATSPLLHIYETSLCMIQLARRQDHEAAHYGLRAVERNPRFSAALSYTAASLGLLGRQERALEVLEKLRAIDPDVSLARIADRELIRIDETATNRLIEGLRRAGLE